MVDDAKKPTDLTKSDVAHGVVRTMLSAVPTVGGPLTEIFALLFTEPVSRRRDRWIADIAGRLLDLEKRLNESIIAELGENESFTSVLLNATQIALRSHQQEKLAALRNAVLNAAVGIVPDDTERHMILGLIDRLTPAHMAVVLLMRDPTANPQVAERTKNIMMGGLDMVVVMAIPAMANRKDLLDLMWRDLVASGLLNSGGLNVTMSGHGLTEKRTTAFGDRFLDFITDPLT